jgi:hypothetical protein
MRADFTPGKIDPTHRVMLIRINRKYRPGISGASLYEATRKFWRVAAKRRELGSLRAPDWAMAVYKGAVLGVFRIEGWEPASASDIAERATREGRWAFHGHQDPEMEKRYVECDVSDYLSGRNPVQYVNVAQ